MSRFGQFVLQYGLDLRDFAIDEDGELVLTETGIEKVYGTVEESED